MSNLNLRQIKAMQHLAETGSFTRAAERLNIAQSALSHQIRELELELGVKLFDRTTRRVELTPAGRDFRSATARVLEQLESAVRQTTELAQRKRGRVSIAAPPLLAAVALPGALAEFRARFPDIEVRIFDARPDDIVRMVRSADVDLAVGTFRSDEEGVASLSIARDELTLFCQAGSQFSTRRTLRWADLAEMPLITMRTSSGLRFLTEAGFESAHVRMTMAFEVSYVSTALAMASAGLGPTILPSYAATVALGLKLVQVPLVDPVVTREIVLLSPAGRSLSPAASGFVRYLRKHVARRGIGAGERQSRRQ